MLAVQRAYLGLRTQPQTTGSPPSSSMAGSNAVESVAILRGVRRRAHAPKHGPGNTHYNTVVTPNTLNSADEDVRCPVGGPFSPDDRHQHPGPAAPNRRLLVTPWSGPGPTSAQ